MLQQIDHSLVKGVVLHLHVRVVDLLAQDVLVEGPGEVTVQQLVVKDSLGDHAPDELEVVQVVGVDVGVGVGHVGHMISGGQLEQGIVRVEHFASNDEVPLSQ